MTNTFAAMATLSASCLALLVLQSPSSSRAPATPPSNASIEETVRTLDREFWDAYNTCDLDRMRELLTDDIEFYHDKGGLTVTREALLDSLSEGLCGPGKPTMRREAATEDAEVFELSDYGAVIRGRHLFHERHEGGTEVPVERAQFFHLWKASEDGWKMSRVISFDHRPAAITGTAIQIGDELLEEYAGVYTAEGMGSVTVTKLQGALNLETDGFSFKALPETENTFFAEGRANLKFSFERDSKSAVHELVVIENGQVVDRATRVR